MNRSFSTSLLRALVPPNPMLLVVFGVAGSVLGLSLLWNSASELFGFGHLGAAAVGLAFAVAAVVLVLLEFAKRYWRERLRH